MALAFRNLTVDPSDPVEVWPTEAVATALERGDLGDWRRIAARIKQSPWGKTARQVEEVLSHSRPYGVAELMEELVRAERERVSQEERDAVAGEVRELIAASGVTRAEFASRIGTSTSRLSTYTTGKVVPSATLLVRMRRLVARVQHAAAYGHRAP